MKKIGSKIALLFLIVSFASVFIPRIYAEDPDDDPQVWIYDVNGFTRDTFNIGDQVNITAYCASMYVPYNITVTDPNSVIKYSKTNIDTNSYSVLLSNVTDVYGPWVVELLGTNGVRYQGGWAAGTYFVIPQVPLGVIGALSACMAGFGLVKIRRRKK